MRKHEIQSYRILRNPATRYEHLSQISTASSRSRAGLCLDSTDSRCQRPNRQHNGTSGRNIIRTDTIIVKQLRNRHRGVERWAGARFESFAQFVEPRLR
jgi:hypothetical protein